MQSLIIGAIAVLAGLALGYWMAKNAAQTEGRLLRQQNDTLDKEKAAALAKASELQDSITRLTGELATANANIASEKQKYTQMQADLEKAFGDLAAKALSANNQSFLTLAKQELGGQTNEAKLILDAKELAIKKLLDPLDVTLKNLNEQARAMEMARAGAYSEVKAMVQNMQQSIPVSLDNLKTATEQLITAFRAPKTRGNWGELQLKRCVEYAGMVQYCSFSEQVSARDEDDKILRPDMTIQLPNGREIVVDAKTPLDAFLDAGNSTDATSQAARFAAHAQRVRMHLKELSGKAYWKQFEKAPDFVVCFLPSEALFSAALEADPSLIEFGAQNHVVMATPTTLIALLRAVEFGWQQMEITKNAKAIHDMGRSIYDKLIVAQGHVVRLGNALRSSVDNYNKLLGTIEGKSGVFFLGRQLGELAHSKDELAEVEKLQTDVREMESQEWSKSGLELVSSPEEASAQE